MQLPNLERREKIVLAVGGLAVAIALVYWVFQGPMQSYKTTKTQLTQAKTRLAQARQMHGQIVGSREESQALTTLMKGRGASYDLWSSVNRAVQTAQLQDRVQTDSLPRELSNASAVKITLTGVSLEELVSLLYEIHSRDSLVVLHAVSHLRPARNEQGLDCELILVTPRS